MRGFFLLRGWGDRQQDAQDDRKMPNTVGFGILRGEPGIHAPSSSSAVGRLVVATIAFDACSMALRTG